jgi:hypothetical protein
MIATHTLEKPIDLKPYEVRAVWDGRKTQLRRIIKPQPPCDCNVAPEEMSPTSPEGWQMVGHSGVWWCPCCTGDWRARSYTPGTRLWVRETWADLRGMGFGNDPRTGKAFSVAYAADTRPGSESDRIRLDYGVKWRSPVTMPRWASRITLVVTDVMAQMVQDISEEDAIEEGVIFTPRERVVSGKLGPADDSGPMRDYTTQPPQWSWRENATVGQSLATARFAYANMFDSHHGAGSWDSNPWVFAYTFKKEVANG